MKDGIVQWKTAGGTINYIRSVKKRYWNNMLVNRPLMSLLSSDCMEVQGLPLSTVGGIRREDVLEQEGVLEHEDHINRFITVGAPFRMWIIG